MFGALFQEHRAVVELGGHLAGMSTVSIVVGVCAQDSVNTNRASDTPSLESIGAVAATGGTISGSLTVEGSLVTPQMVVGSSLQVSYLLVAGGANAKDDLYLLAKINPTDYQSAGLVITIFSACRWHQLSSSVYHVAFGHNCGDPNYASKGDEYLVTRVQHSGYEGHMNIVASLDGHVEGRKTLQVWAKPSAYCTANIHILALGNTVTPGKCAKVSASAVKLIT
jgi:hypothetical protein